MLKKILFSSIILVLSWSLVLNFLPTGLDMNQNQWNSNLIKAESYLFERPALKNTVVILGSSMAASIPINKVNDSLINLAFAGLSAYDGLELVMAKAQKPTTVYIETNTIFKDGNEEFQNAVFSPIRHWLKSVFSVFLIKNQPVAVVKGLIRYKKADRKANILSTLEEVPPAINRTILEMSVKQYATYPSNALIMTRLTKLASFVRALEEKGCNIVFFEMPVHPSLCHSALSTKIREELPKWFPREQFTYIPQPGCTLFHTTDGIHLTAVSAALYAAYLNTNINRMTYSTAPTAHRVN